MKNRLGVKLCFAVLIGLFSHKVLAQASVEIYEDFSDFSNNWNDHPDWSVIDNDGLNDNIWTNSNWSVSSSWEVIMTSSDFSPPGQADDWVIIPQLTIASSYTPYLKWVASSYTSNSNTGSDYSDYEVLISTTTDNMSDFSVLTTVLLETQAQTEHFVDLTAYAGQQVYIAFRNMSDEKYILRIHELEVGSAAQYDGFLGLDSFGHPFIEENQTLTDLTFFVENTGIDGFVGFDLNWDIDNGASSGQVSYSSTLAQNGSAISGLNLSADPPNSGAVGEHVLRVWLDITPGDMINTNDTIYLTFNTISELGEKHVVIDEGTGTWCSYCTDGMARLDDIVAQHGDAVVPVGLHSGDVMSHPKSDSLLDAFITGYPRAAIDRFRFNPTDDIAWSRNYWSDRTIDRLAYPTPFDIDLTYTFDSTTNLINADVTVTSYGNMYEDFSIGLYIIEDEVGGDSEYDQSNYYDNTAGHPYQGLGSPITNFKHKNVFRDAVGSVWGNLGAIPNPTTDGGTYTKSFSYTLPTTYDALHGDDVNSENIKLVAFVANHSTESYAIQNVIEKSLIDPSSGIDELTDQWMVYPVPANDLLTIMSKGSNLQIESIQLIDLTGRNVELNYTETGGNQLDLNVKDLPSGTYLLYINSGVNSIVKRVSVKR